MRSVNEQHIAKWRERKLLAPVIFIIQMRPTVIFETLETARFEGSHSGVVEDATLCR